MTILARALSVAAVAWLLCASVGAQPTDPLRLYNEALVRESALRAEIASASEADAVGVRRRVRTLVGAYRDLARLFPASGVGDKALWQGGMLSADTFDKWGEAQDRSAALRAFEALSNTYPSSSLVRQVPGQTRKLSETAARVAAPVPSPTPSTAAPVAVTKPSVLPPAAPPEPPASPAAPAAPAAILTAIRHELMPEALRVTLEVDRETVFSSERLDGPARVFVDLQRTRASDTLRDAVIPVASGVVQRIRVGRHPGGLTRVVLDLTSAGRHSVYPLYDPYRVVIDLELPPGSAAAQPLPVTPPRTLAPAPVPAPAPLLFTRTPLGRTWTLATQGPRVGAQGVSAEVDQGPRPTAQGFIDESIPASTLTTAAAAPTAAAKTGRGDYSLSRQLGLGIARIVIDAGHGGHDPGAKVRGLSEADLVLDIAQRLEQLLRAQPGVEVVQTRRSDVYLSLEERTEIANRADADLFISIHANASTNPRTRGVETYVLNFAPNPEAEAVAARENAGSRRTMRELPDLVKAIALNNKADESRELARFVQDSLHAQLRKGDTTLRNLGVKQAPFMVLVGATMPAILTEVAFVTNQQDAPRLRRAAYRQEVAAALLRGITRYQQSLKKASTVAAQQ